MNRDEQYEKIMKDLEEYTKENEELGITDFAILVIPKDYTIMELINDLNGRV